MESKKTIQVNQKYSPLEMDKIIEKSKEQHLKVATFIRKCVLESLERLNK